MIGLALSGGGSRAIAFHLGCLRALNDLDLLNKINVLSTISGGSVIGAYYAYTPEKSFEEFENDICTMLKAGFHHKIAAEFLNPVNLSISILNLFSSLTQELIKLLRETPSDKKISRNRTDFFINILKSSLYNHLLINSPTRNNIDIVIGACELRSGSAFRFNNKLSGSWRLGSIEDNNIEIAFAVAASAAYPVLLPTLERYWCFKKNSQKTHKRISLTDGGVYDNLGVQVLEPGRNPKYSLHTFPCEYLIVCNAGRGQDLIQYLPSSFLSRCERTFEIVHRRVQNSIMNRLHRLKDIGLVKGFAMPYLGQIDQRLPWIPPDLIPRSDVINYPTDFAPMNKFWVDKISNRGEQLTHLLVTHYLKDLVSN